MNLIEIYRRFPDQESCIEHLEAVRWGDTAACPKCGSLHVARKVDGDRVGRWNCHDCHASFNVLSGTVLCKTRVDLQRWFLAIGLMVNAKKSLSSHQLARDIDVTQPTARYMQHRIRAAMVDQQAGMLQGIVEADETYVGGKPRKANRKKDRKPAKTGRGTSKTPVLGAVERGGNVVAMAPPGPGGIGGKAIIRFLKRHMDPKGSLLITDQYPAYNTTAGWTSHTVINHSIAYVQGKVHTNTIEGFWSLLKRAWFGSHHHYAVKYMPLYVAEATWKYNHRKDRNAFSTFLREAMA